MKHLYIFFWRTDTFEKMLSPVMALCRHVADKSDVTCSMAEVDCPACRETFIECLPMGSGKGMTFDEYAAKQAEAKRLADEANAHKIATQNAAWTTYSEAAPVSQAAWDNLKPADAGWTTAAKPDDGWTTKPKGS